MVARRRLSPGGSYGRAQVVITWVQDNWQHFDSWCCVRNIDPIDLPAYRVYNLALVVIKEDLTDPDPDITAQQLAALDLVLRECDNMKNPLKRISISKSGRALIRPNTKEEEPKPASTPSPESRHKYIPPWWQGDEKNYQVAKAAMGGISSLPKMQR